MAFSTVTQIESDKKANQVWLPYTQMSQPFLSMEVESAEGSRIYLKDGTSLLDGIASWWVMCHGYSNHYILEHMQEQMSKMPHVMFANFSNAQATRFADRILKKAGMHSIVLTESGSVAVETAMKIALQYHQNRGDARRNRFLYFKNGYHGETLGALSVTDVEWRASVPFVEENYRFVIPETGTDWEIFERQLEAIHNNVAGVIIEPLVQFAGGMRMHTAQTLKKLFVLSKRYHLLFIVDEIATGFYRTGTFFAYEQASVKPDILVIGKAMAAGYCAAGGVLVQQFVYDAFLEEGKELMHGTTFMGNPVTCAAANASLDLFEREEMSNKIASIEGFFVRGLQRFLNLKSVKAVRVQGAIGVVELRNDTPAYIASLRSKVVERGIWLRPFSNVLYVTPPFIIKEEELQSILDAAFSVLEAVS